MLQWKIGAVTVTQILEWSSDTGVPGLVPEATRDAVRSIDWLRPEFATDDGDLQMNLQAFVIETSTQRILVDTCIGEDKDLPLIPFWHQLRSNFLRRLQDAGYPYETISTVLCTHLHVDHSGWNTVLRDGRWVPTFPNARYLFGRREYEYLSQLVKSGGCDNPAMAKIDANVLRNSVAPIVEAGLAEFVDMDQQICPEVSFVPSPGHTPGHVSVRIESEGEEALITGDFVVHPCQVAHPEWQSAGDVDVAGAVATRRHLYSEMLRRGGLVIGTHWTGPVAARIEADGASLRLAF